MTLKACLERMSRALERPRDARDGRWAHELCTDSRAIHEAVWCCRPKREFVQDEIIPLLDRAGQAILDVPREGEYSDHIEIFARNIESRSRNLWNYARGRPSDFAPPLKLEEANRPHVDPKALLDELTKETK